MVKYKSILCIIVNYRKRKYSYFIKKIYNNKSKKLKLKISGGEIKVKNLNLKYRGEIKVKNCGILLSKSSP